MKHLLLLSLLILPGCFVGTSHYVVRPFELDSGQVICCEAEIYNTKDVQSAVVMFEKTPDGGLKVEVDQQGVSASNPAMLQAENNARLLELAAKVIPPQ